MKCQYRKTEKTCSASLVFSHTWEPSLPTSVRRLPILRDLLKKDVPFEWSDDHQHAFVKLKGAISEQALVAFYDSTKPIALEVDASQKGLGAALIQEGRPIAFASKSLTKTQSNYSNIRTWNTSPCTRRREVSHLSIWQILYNHIRPQAPRNDMSKVYHISTSSTPKDVAEDSRIWL